VTKNDLVNAVAAHGLSKRQSSSVVESVFDTIFNCFEKGEDVKIVGFGHFRIRQKASRRGRNPQTGDSIEITARKVLTFKPSKGLKQRINSPSVRHAPTVPTAPSVPPQL
jgi:integration host factor subunit alpha